MARSSDDKTLLVARGVLKILMWLNLAAAILFVLVLAISFVGEPRVVEALEQDSLTSDPRTLIAAVRIVMAIALLAVPLAHLILSRLIAMVDTVRSGDPFVAENGRRLTTTAWALLALQFLDLGFGAVSLGMVSGVEQFDWSFGLTGWIAVLMLFVLARVFHHGARLREDLEGTI